MERTLTAAGTGTGPGGDEYDLLEVADYRRLHRLLDDVASAGARVDVREQVLEGLARHFGWRHTTFFTGPSLRTTFHDRAPVLRGRAVGMGTPFLEHYWPYDVFNLPRNRVLVRDRGAASLDELDLRHGEVVDYYLDRFLRAHRVRSEVLMGLRLDGAEAIIGVLDARDHAYDRHDVALSRVLARQLARVLVLPSGPADPLAGLSAREREVARLVGEGLTNAEVAAALFVSVDTVKKHLTSVFGKTGCRSRAELVRLLATVPAAR
ncbi:helix-turn-helix transcriptional regulator [Geodermatophilus sp. SYSU D00696]